MVVTVYLSGIPACSTNGFALHVIRLTEQTCINNSEKVIQTLQDPYPSTYREDVVRVCDDELRLSTARGWVWRGLALPRSRHGGTGLPSVSLVCPTHSLLLSCPYGESLLLLGYQGYALFPKPIGDATPASSVRGRQSGVVVSEGG